MGNPGPDSYNSLLCLVSRGCISISPLSESDDSIRISISPLSESDDSISSIAYDNPSPNLFMHKRNVNENYPEEIFAKFTADATQSNAANSAAVACVENDVRKRQKTSATRWKPFSSTGSRSSTVVQRAFDGRELGPPPSRYKKIVTSELSGSSSPDRPVSPKGFPRHVQSLSRRLQDGRDYSPLYIWRLTCPQSRYFPRVFNSDMYLSQPSSFSSPSTICSSEYSNSPSSPLLKRNYSKEIIAHTMQNDPVKAAVVACVETNVPKRQRKSRTRWRPFSSTCKRSSVPMSPSNRRELESTSTQPEIPLDLSISASHGRMPASPKWVSKKRKKNEVSQVLKGQF